MRRPGYWVHGAVSLQNAQAYDAIRQLFKYKYTALGNELLKWPAWQVYMFLLAPFSSVAGDVCYLDTGKTHVRDVSALYCRKDRAALWETVDGFQDEWARALRPPARPSAPSIRDCCGSFSGEMRSRASRRIRRRRTWSMGFISTASSNAWRGRMSQLFRRAGGAHAL